MNARRRWSAPATMAALLVSCAAQQSRPNEFYPAAPVQLLLLNESEEVICYVETQSAGQAPIDELDVDDVVAPGEERGLTIRGTKSLTLRDCNRQIIFEREEILFDEEGKVLRFYSRE